MNAHVDITALAIANGAIPDLAWYDRILVAFSGGKDSVACVLTLLENGVPPSKIMLIHHEVDGREGSSLMDWPSTPAYCEAFARWFGFEMISSWRRGGFEAEMNRQQQPTQGVSFERGNALTHLQGAKNAPLGTRLAYPQVAADLSVRWCSAALKIDVADRVLCNDPLFERSKTLFVTGERGEESPNRARYAQFEPHRADRRDGKKGRLVDHWRPVLRLLEQEVWAIIARFGVVPHPAYQAGFGRLSCRNCIFASDDQWATLALHDPKGIKAISAYELKFGRTIHRKLSVRERIARGTPYEAATPELMARALSTTFEGPIVIDPADWTMPAGAFKGHSGPT